MMRPRIFYVTEIPHMDLEFSGRRVWEWFGALSVARAIIAVLQLHLVCGVCTPCMGGAWNVASVMPRLDARD